MKHGHGLVDDLPLLRRLATRRNVLRTLGGVGVAGMAVGATGHLLGLPGPWMPDKKPYQVGGLFADPQSVAGPFPADGTNTSDGPTSNILRQSGIVRSDLTRSFIGSTGLAAGVPLDLDLRLLAVDRGGAPLMGCAVYIWHCDSKGIYSLYDDGAAESWLRGVQMADKDGHVRFKTVFPGAYGWRWPHVHVEVHRSLEAIRTGVEPLLTTQLALPAKVARRIYADTANYPKSLGNLPGSSPDDDILFSHSSQGELAQQTIEISLRNGVTLGAARIGIAGI